MGKEGKERRPKNQKGPVSSSQAQNFLLNTNSDASSLSNAFARFKNRGLVSSSSSTATTTTTTTTSSSLSTGGQIVSSITASYDDIGDPILRQNFKHLLKKNATTRIKALQQISSSISETKEKKDLVIILPEWLSSLKKLCVDNERRVRELAFNVFKQIIEIVKKDLGPYLKTIIGLWFIVMHERERDVSKAATNAFNAAFPPEKRANVIIVCQNEILNQIQDLLFKQNIQTLSSPDMTTSEAEERYNRIIHATLESFSHILQAQHEHSKSVKKLSTELAPTTTTITATTITTTPKDDESTSDNQPHPLVSEICSHNLLWKYITTKDYPDIRSSAYKLVATISRTYPQLLLAKNKQQKDVLNSAISLSVLGCFSEQSQIVHKNMMESLIGIMQQYSIEQVWSGINPQKAIFPRLFSFLRNPATSSPSVTFPSLLPFLSFINYEVLGSSEEKTFNFFDQFFSNMWIGFRHPAIQQTDAHVIITTFCECFMYSILQIGKYVSNSEEGNKFISNFQEGMTKKYFINYVTHFYFMKKTIGFEKDYLNAIGRTLEKFMLKDNLDFIVSMIFNSMLEKSLQCLRTKYEDIKIEVTNKSILLEEAKDDEQNEDNVEDKRNSSEKAKKNVKPTSGKPTVLEEEIISCEDPCAFINRLKSLFKLLDKFNSNNHLQHLKTNLFTESLKLIISEDSLPSLRSVLMLCDNVPLSQLCNQDTLFSDYLIPIFKKSYTKCNEFTLEIFNLLSVVFNSYPQKLNEMYESLIVPLLEVPHNLYEMLTRMRNIEHLNANTTDDLCLRVASKAFESDTSDKCFCSLIKNLEYMILEISTISVPCIIKIASSIVKFTSKEQSADTLIAILGLIYRICQKSFSIEMDDKDKIYELRGVILGDLMKFVFDKQLTGLNAPIYVSDLFSKEIQLEKTENQTPDVALGETARRLWKLIASETLEKVSEKEKQQFIEERILSLRSILLDEKSSTYVSHEIIYSLIEDLRKFVKDEKNIWEILLFNKDSWDQLYSRINKVTRLVTVGSRTYAIGTDEISDALEIFRNLQNYVRYLCFVVESLKKLPLSELFLCEDGEALQNQWLICNIVHSLHFVDILKADTSETLMTFITQQLLPETIWLSGKQHTVEVSVQGKLFADRIISICDMLFDDDENKLQKDVDIELLIKLTLTYLKNIYEEKNMTIATKFMRDLFKAVNSTYLFKSNQLMDIIKSDKLLRRFYIMIEAFYNPENEETGLNAYVAKKLMADEELAVVDDFMTTWLAQAASLLVQVTGNIQQEGEQYDRIRNTLSFMSALVVIFTNMMGEQYEEIQLISLVDILKDFMEKLLDSTVANDYTDFMDITVSKLITFIVKRAKENAIRPEHYGFIANFVEQHTVRCTSYLSSDIHSSSILDPMLSSLFNMAEMMAALLSNIKFYQNSKLILERLYTQCLTSFICLCEFKAMPTPIAKRYGRIAGDIIDQLSVIIEGIPAEQYTHIDMESQFYFSKCLLKVIQAKDGSASCLAQYACYQGLKSHQDYKQFLKKSVKKKQAKGIDTNKSDMEDASAMNEIRTGFTFHLFEPLSQILSSPPILIRPSSQEPLKLKHLQHFSSSHEITNSQSMFCYLLCWNAFEEMYQRYLSHADSNDDIKLGTLIMLKQKKWYIALLDILFGYVLLSPSSRKETSLLPSMVNSQDFVSDDAKVSLLNIQGKSSVSHHSLTLLSAQLLFKMFKLFPSLCRFWYTDINDKALSDLISKFVTEYISPLVVKEEMGNIKKKSASLPSNVKIKVAGSQITATYEQDEVCLDIKLGVGSSHPLQPLEIQSSKRLGVEEQLWRQWILKMTTLLFTQAGNLWDALMIWKSNLDNHFSGVEPCPICYSIVHTNDQSLPKIICKVCKSKYHSACLYKWIKTSGNTSCPTCRSTNSFGIG